MLGQIWLVWTEVWKPFLFGFPPPPPNFYVGSLRVFKPQRGRGIAYIVPNMLLASEDIKQKQNEV